MDCYDKNILYYGKSNNLPEKHFLSAGDLMLIYENGCLRSISANGTVLILNVYSAVRDRNWGTIQPNIIKESINQTESDFSITYTAQYTNSEIDFIAEYQISGKENSIVFSMNGKAQRDFMKNRIGFCILHPLEGVKGLPCTLIHPGGMLTESKFPEFIATDCPMKNIAGMKWENDTALCRLTFEGDIWEMEDHRNWTDSSYKTYCTPLSIPFPAEIKKNTEVFQKITFEVELKQKSLLNENTILQLYIEKQNYSFPEIGTCLIPRVLSKKELEVLSRAGLKYLRYDLKFNDINWAEKFETAVINSENLTVPLELVLHFSQNARHDAELLKEYLQNCSVKIKKVWFINESSRKTNDSLIFEVKDLLRNIFPSVSLGSGTDAYFAEFNRNRFDASQLDFVTFAVCPQVHAFDNDSLVENLAAQADTVLSARNLYPGKQIHISPITLKQRFNVVATGDEPPTPENELPPQVDERQMSLFAAGWTIGSLASVIKSEAAAVTYYEAIGWKGIIMGEEENSKPQLFSGKKGDIFPVYHLLMFINTVNPINIKTVLSSEALKISAIVLETKSGSYLVAANHTINKVNCRLQDVSALSFIELSAENMPSALKDEMFLENQKWAKMDKNNFSLKPYALYFLRLD